jgi:hypothetical protein
MLSDDCRVQRQIQALYAMQNEQWREHSQQMQQYKKELNTQHAAMQERFAQHEANMHALRKETLQHLHDARTLLHAKATSS